MPANAEMLHMLIGELKRKSLAAQFATDIEVWRRAVERPGEAGVGELLSRVFTLLRFGGLLYRVEVGKPWQWWRAKKWPLAAALSHGGRVVIQLPETETLAFWRWLYGDGRAAYERVTPKRGSGKGHDRSAAHSLEPDRPTPLLDGRIKRIREKGLDALDVARNRHFGINLALGGQGLVSPISGEPIDGKTGAHGHLYLYVNDGVGCMLGCEGSQPGVTDVYGQTPEPSGLGGEISPTGGSKWRDLADGPGCGGPKSDCLFIDLRASGWRFLSGLERGFRTEWLAETSLEAPPLDTAPGPSLEPSSEAALIDPEPRARRPATTTRRRAAAPGERKKPEPPGRKPPTEPSEPT